MKKQFKPLPLTCLLMLNLFIAVSVFAQETPEEINIHDCGKPQPCVTAVTSKAKMPIPCNCIPKGTNLLNVKITIKSAQSDRINVKVVNSQGRVYAKSDAAGGRLDYDQKQGVATLRLGAVDRSLASGDLKLIITTFVPGANGRLAEKEYTVNIEK